MKRSVNLKLEIIQSEKQKKRMKKNEHSLRDLWDAIKHTSTGIIGVPERGVPGEEKQRGKKYIFEEMMVKIYQIWGKIRIFYARSLINSEIYSKTHFSQIIKTEREKGEFWKYQKRSDSYKKASIIWTANFPLEALGARRKWDNIFKTLKERTIYQ